MHRFGMAFSMLGFPAIQPTTRRGFSLIACLLIAILVSGCDAKTPKEDTPPPVASSSATQQGLSGANILVFSKTAGFRHDSIPAGIKALQELAREHKFNVVATEDSSQFSDENLRSFNAVIFLNTTGNVLDEDQQIAMERFIQAGGGFVGIHAATDTEWQGDWFWFRNLVGAVFANHPNEPSNVQTATVLVTDKNHASTANLPDSFSLADEWYNFRDIYEFINVVAKVDENTYQGGEHNHDHPISWYHEYDGGRAFYTGLGHTDETFSNPQFLQHLLGGLTYAMGLNYNASEKPKLDYSKVRPEDNRFIKKTLVEKLDEPVKLAFFPNGDALIALRPGRLVRVDYKTGELHEAGTLKVGYDKFMEFGLVGVAIDEDFANNPWVYAAFTVVKDSEKLAQRLSRFKWINDQLDSSTEQILLEYPVDKNCCHTGGDLQFGDNGELFFSTGDNTNPHDQEGSSPVDFRPDMKKNDGLRGAGNTMDLRGKVLRIKPTAEGGYEIPAGNLFNDPAQGRPEIYVMGARNPYSITFDKKTGHLFYGDIGPDASKDTDEKGSQGYDEINRVTAAGNFGWPLVIGKNRPYRFYDYATKKSGDWVDPAAPLNISPNNTGAKELPPAQPAFIAYPYGISEEFPEMGTGGRTALVADVYHAENYPASENRYPAYYDNKLFILDFMRAWVKVVSFDTQGRIKKIEPFAPQISYALPIDARFAPDGTLYVLEYGMSWFTGNPDARLARIEYVGAGNRPPVAQIDLDKTRAGVPAKIKASATASRDLDGDKFQYQWTLKSLAANGTATDLGSDVDLTLDIEQPGEYQLILSLTDSHGATASSQQSLTIGNEPPAVQIKSTQNKSFYWADTKKFAYEFAISDKEDGVITGVKNNNPMIQFTYKGGATDAALGHQTASLTDQAQSLIDANNCLACHKLDEKVVGPAFRDVAKKYQNDPNGLKYLVNKIGNGGSGVWGEMNMPAFAGLSEQDLTALATYVLSLTEDNAPKSLPLSGTVQMKDHKRIAAKFDEPYIATGESYVFDVSYTEKDANGIKGIAIEKTFSLVPPRFDFASALDEASLDKTASLDKFRDRDVVNVKPGEDWAGFTIGHYDLSSVNKFVVGAFFLREPSPWKIEIYQSADMKVLLGSTTVMPEKLWVYSRAQIPLSKKLDDYADLYIRVKPEGKSSGELRLMDIEFVR